ncbi:hypothetical protein SEA_DIZZYRUDY_18 [Microbacterium phage DizzyRudy]|nr:hypothetical protein SEA_DIZZYRUDY_18 [Microbacterium phage DizzyRudy]
MLTITVPGVESFDDDNQIFVRTEAAELKLEHSLVSLSKWESRYEKPFLSGEEKTDDEIRGYVNAMSLDGDISLEVLHRLTGDNFRDINQYIESKMTATWFRETDQPRGFNPDVVTAEVIYHWIVALQIDWESQYWHLNRLITLVKTINEKNKAASDTKRKAPTSGQMSDRRALMEKRRAEAAARAAQNT